MSDLNRRAPSTDALSSGYERVIEVLNRPGGAVLRRMRSHDPTDISLSAIAIYELYYGAFKSRRQESNLELVDGLRFEILQFDREDARHSGEIRAALATRGTPMGAYDALIAGQARSRGLTLIRPTSANSSGWTG
jgi:tRNA(fMet)-specific endonuclease VapC